MDILIPRQERFCQAFVHYGAAAAAARAAGYAPASSRRQGWRLMRAPRIQARIREIQADLADHRDRADAAVIGKLEIVYRRALEDHQYYAAARAAYLQAQLMRRHANAPAGAMEDGPAGVVKDGPAGVVKDAPMGAMEMDTSGVHKCPESPKPSPMCPSPEAAVSNGLRVAGRGG